MGCGSSAASAYNVPPTPVPVAETTIGRLHVSSKALEVVAQPESFTLTNLKSATAHRPTAEALEGLEAGEAGQAGPLDRDDLSYGPSFGPIDFEEADRSKFQKLPVQPGSYILEGVYAKTDNSDVYLGATSGAMKIIVKRISKQRSAQPYETHVNEVRCLLRLQHDRIVKLLGVFDSCYYLDIILEYCPSGALRNFVERGECEQLLPLLCDVSQGLSYLHAECFAHLDVKPHNILVEGAPGGRDPRLRVSSG